MRCFVVVIYGGKIFFTQFYFLYVQLRIGHENLKELYEKVLCSEKRWKSSAESSFASGKQLRDHCTKLEETLNDVFQIFDATANKASEYEG